MDGTLFFAADDGSHGESSGRATGPRGDVLVKDINARRGRSAFPPTSRTSSGTLFFAANDGSDGRELWKSDGTAAGTVLVKDISPRVTPAISRPAYLTNVERDALLHGR